MLKLLSVLVVLGFVASASAADKSRKTNSLPPSKSVGRFVDKVKGFSIALPAGWTQDKDTLGTAVMAISKADDKKDAFRENINVVVENLNESITPKDYFDASQNAIKRVFQEFKLEKSGKQKVANKDFYWSVFSHKTPTSKARVLQYVSVNGKKAYIITCSASPENFAKYKPTFMTSVTSFKFE